MAERSRWQWLWTLLEKLTGWSPLRSRPGGPDSPGRHSADARATRSSAEAMTLDVDGDWPRDGPEVESLLRVAYSLLKQGDPVQLVVASEPDPVTKSRDYLLPLHIELSERVNGIGVWAKLEKVGLAVPRMYFSAAESGNVRSARYVTATLPIPRKRETGTAGSSIDLEALRNSILMILNEPVIRRVELAMPLSACRGGSLGDIGLPANRTIGGRKVDGNGVIVGIVDDGCALASRNFTTGAPSKSRILYLWDQSPVVKDAAKGWTRPNDINYGYELANLAAPYGNGTWIDDALAAHTQGGVIDEDRVHAAVDYVQRGTGAHGTHVMDIAAGNGTAMFGAEGVAPAADIIFVQLPVDAVEAGGLALSKCLQDGTEYIFERARQLDKPAVVNISYGGYRGPHDGTSQFELGFDDQLAEPNRAIVLAAGNGFGANCHAEGAIAAAPIPVQSAPPQAQGAALALPAEVLAWWVPPDDASLNLLDLWYNATAELWLYLTPPGSATELGPVVPGAPPYKLQIGSTVVGWVDHFAKDKENGDRHITVQLRPTIPGTSGSGGGSLDAAPFGVWKVRLENRAASPARFHAWIERDEPRQGSSLLRRQSRFDPLRADPKYTVTGIATGRKTIAVGAFNSATNEVPDYSACGPTRASASGPPRYKPEVCAPAATDVPGLGVLSASSSRALDTRMNGTSASAPHVSGLAALALQLHRDLHANDPMPQPLPIGALRWHIVRGAMRNARKLKPSAHQLKDPAQPHKQSDAATWRHLKGFGAIDAFETLRRMK